MSYFVTAKIIGDKELKAAFQTAPKVVAKELGGAIEKGAREVESRAKQYAPAQFGQLRQSIDVKGPYFAPDNIFASVGSDKKYALYQEEGTGLEGPKGQMIRPKAGKVLAWKVGGKWMFAKQSRGTKPKYYMKRAKEQVEPLFTDYARKAISAIISHLARG